VSHGLTVRRGGAYNRLAEPDWVDPLDTSYSKDRGGRWNPPGSFGVLHLNPDERMARVQVAHRLAGRPYGIEDLDPAEQHDLVTVELPRAVRLDCVTDKGLTAVGLPTSYPLDSGGSPVGYDLCRAVGQQAYEAGRTGIACRSAARGAESDDEELAVFDTHTDSVKFTGRRPFSDWFLGASTPE
jgi:hypothetical protein